MSREAGRSHAHAWVWAVGVLVLISVTGDAIAGTRDHTAPRLRAAAKPVVTTWWADGGGRVPVNGVARGRINVAGVGPDTHLAVRLSNARFATIPGECIGSAATVRNSWISGDGRTLHCVARWGVSDALSVSFVAVADIGAQGFLTGTASVGETSMELPGRPLPIGVEPLTPGFRLLSAPDFINADIADLARGDADFDPATETNGINGYYRRALDMVLDDWANKSPDDILVAGDLVDGHWGLDRDRLQVFGPVATAEEQKAAVARAGDVYYTQWAARFRAHGLTNVHPAIGDHEYGDNDWPRWKLDFVSAYQDVWAEHFTTKPSGEPRFAVRPRGSIHESSAYAWRPRPDVQLITARRVHTRAGPGCGGGSTGGSRRGSCRC